MTTTPSSAPGQDGPLVLYLVKQLEQVSRARLDAVLRGSGVTALQYTALTVLARSSAMSQADLARHSFVRAQSAADLVKVLEGHGFIVREPDPENRRRLLCRLTPVGEAFLARYEQPVRELEEAMLSRLDAEERAALARTIRGCRDSLAGR